MGNCQAAIASDADSGNHITSRIGGWRRKKSDGSPHKKDDGLLVAAPGRIFSNEGRSSTASIYTQQGRKGVNQDAMILWQDCAGEGSVFCGVFDGHGPQGHLVARQVRDALPLKLLSFLPKPGRGAGHRAALGCFGGGYGRTDTCAASSWEEELPPHGPSLSAWREAFVRSYKAMDKELRWHATLDCFCSGSTAVTLLKLGSNIFVGNIGDSRAILASKDDDGDGSLVAIQLTVDLKPNLPSEEERIRRCKGRVFALQEEPEVQRVWLPFDDAPGLAMARAFGDFCLKDYGVISVPEFFHRTITEKDQFVVLASDGVWDVLSNKEVVDIISSSPTRSTAAKLLTEAASREWKLKYPTSKVDDCAVVCLFLDGKMETESESLENRSSTVVYCSFEDSNDELSAARSYEPTLDRNCTVRATMTDKLAAVVEEKGEISSEDQNWSGLEGVTRVNSMVQLPRFSGEKT